MFKCSVCKMSKPKSEYYADATKKRGVGAYCKECGATNRAQRMKERKEQAVEYKGGKCEICGYNKSMRALCFHHTAPEEKDVLFRNMSCWKLDRVKAEVDKCQLLCLNCHAEVHEDLDRK